MDFSLGVEPNKTNEFISIRSIDQMSYHDLKMLHNYTDRITHIISGYDYLRAFNELFAYYATSDGNLGEIVSNTDRFSKKLKEIRQNLLLLKGFVDDTRAFETDLKRDELIFNLFSEKFRELLLKVPSINSDASSYKNNDMFPILLKWIVDSVKNARAEFSNDFYKDKPIDVMISFFVSEIKKSRQQYILYITTIEQNLKLLEDLVASKSRSKEKLELFSKIKLTIFKTFVELKEGMLSEKEKIFRPMETFFNKQITFDEHLEKILAAKLKLRGKDATLTFDEFNDLVRIHGKNRISDIPEFLSRYLLLLAELDIPLSKNYIRQLRSYLDKIVYYLKKYDDMSQYYRETGILDDFGIAYKKNYLDARLRSIMGQAGPRTDIGLVFIDIDDFSSINDTYGHALGDEILKFVMNTIKTYIRSDNDFLVRYGGEELVVCFEGANKNIILKKIKAISKIIEDAGNKKYSLIFQGKDDKYKKVRTRSKNGVDTIIPSTTITFSAGIVCLNGKIYKEYNDKFKNVLLHPNYWVSIADFCMYISKEQRKNNFLKKYMIGSADKSTQKLTATLNKSIITVADNKIIEDFITQRLNG